MKMRIMGLSILLGATASVATANTTMVGCPGYAVSMSEDVAIKGQVLAGSIAAFEKVVCEHSKERADFEGEPRSIPVYIDALEVSTRVIIFPVSGSDNRARKF